MKPPDVGASDQIPLDLSERAPGRAAGLMSELNRVLLHQHLQVVEKRLSTNEVVTFNLRALRFARCGIISFSDTFSHVRHVMHTDKPPAATASQIQSCSHSLSRSKVGMGWNSRGGEGRGGRVSGVEGGEGRRRRGGVCRKA